MTLYICLRRGWISNILIFLWCLGSGKSAISSFASADFVNESNEDVCSSTATRRDVEGPFYTDDTPWTDRIAPEEQLEISSNRLVVEGSVIGRNCQPVGNVLVEPWYAGLPDGEGNLYSSKQGGDKRYRGRFYSDADGNYRYVQTFPEVYQARDIRHVHLKFSAVTPQKNHTLTTQMYFRGFLPPKYEWYLQGRDSQIVDIFQIEATGERKVILDIILDVDGIPPALTTQTAPAEEPASFSNDNPSIPPTIKLSSDGLLCLQV
eukprot:CAMPEP_0194220266 /NCGR_PEP_ID=MMETSP0156-20130528/27918_1 /TAXON_ID=33649 /ORGANISM="Thalassionema nitzschioides, Strain L26-B" /LENGTH=262 /DNA_ID=CAMNT_0038950233 /DNA_START=80 /DNA_END=869 /DNA_ORIENTATION=-